MEKRKWYSITLRMAEMNLAKAGINGTFYFRMDKDHFKAEISLDEVDVVKLYKYFLTLDDYNDPEGKKELGIIGTVSEDVNDLLGIVDDSIYKIIKDKVKLSKRNILIKDSGVPFEFENRIRYFKDYFSIFIRDRIQQFQNDLMTQLLYAIKENKFRRYELYRIKYPNVSFELMQEHLNWLGSVIDCIEIGNFAQIIVYKENTRDKFYYKPFVNKVDLGLSLDSLEEALITISYYLKHGNTISHEGRQMIYRALDL